jgi:ABC-type glycerol-3-phosphate transport system substrate-binding protein
MIKAGWLNNINGTKMGAEQRMMKRIGMLACLACLASTAAACSKGAETPAAPVKDSASEVKKTVSNEPVTLKLLMPKWSFTDEEYKKFVVEPLKKKHPNITLEQLIVDINEKKLQEAVTQGIEPDIIFTSSNIMAPLQSVGFLGDMEPVIKANGFDTSRLQSGSLQAIKTSSSVDYLTALPYTQNFSVLYYNKDLFDKFGVAYPKDGMTWDDAAELAKKLSRTDNGVAYRGLNTGKIARNGSQLSLPAIDPKTNKATVTTDGWKKVFEMQKSVFSIAGNSYIPEGQALTQFTKDRTLAMLAFNNFLARLSQEGAGMNWDMSTYPSFKEKPGIGINYDLHIMAIAAGSKKKDQALQVISTLLSDEAQLDMARNGRQSVLQKDSSMRSEYGKNLSYLQGKNVQAIFKTTPAPNVPPSKYEDIAKPKDYLNDKTTKVVFEQGVDINTALRQAEEEINKLIDQNKK